MVDEIKKSLIEKTTIPGTGSFLSADCPYCGKFKSLGAETPSRPASGVQCLKCRKWFVLSKEEGD